MNRDLSTRPAFFLAMAFAGALLLSPSSARAQNPSPDDWDIEIRADRAAYAPGDTVKTTAGVVARKQGLQGWSYGVKHDVNVLDVESVTVTGTDVPSLFSGGFDQTTLVEEGGKPVGYIQAIILTFQANPPVVVPVSDYFKMAAATYKVTANACAGKNQDYTSKVEFTTELGVPNSPPVDINLTVGGKAVVPTKLLGKQIEIQCQVNAGDGLALQFEDGIPDLVADKSTTLDVKIFLANRDTSGTIDVQGWSYGIELDDTELDVTKGAPGADSKALNGGAGPDFVNYNLADQNTGGTAHGVTIGAVLDLDAPAKTVLGVGAGASKHIDSITVRSRKEIPAGGSSRTTDLKFSSQLGGNRPLEILAVVAGESVVPDSTDTKTIRLVPRGAGGADTFIRGDANNDARVDIADGIWIINALFYGGDPTACAPAADANDDDRRDLTDAMYIFQYQLQPGRTPGNLFPAPPAPFPNCGSHPDATAENCPQGSTSC